MPTYSKETALYDTGKIATDITGAGETASKYITAIDNNGIKVHAENNPTTNYTKIDANGMEVYQKVNDTATKVAGFGVGGATIGADGTTQLQLASDGIRGVDSETNTYFEVGYDVNAQTRGTKSVTSPDVEYSSPYNMTTSNSLNFSKTYTLNNIETGSRITTGQSKFRYTLPTEYAKPSETWSVYSTSGCSCVWDDVVGGEIRFYTNSYTYTQGTSSTNTATCVLQNRVTSGQRLTVTIVTAYSSANNTTSISFTASTNSGTVKMWSPKFMPTYFKYATFVMPSYLRLSDDFQVDSGNVTVAGDLTASNIGAKNWVAPSSVSCQTGKWYKVAEVELDPGIWFIDCNALFPSTSATGTRQIRVTTETFTNGTTTLPGSYGNITNDILAGANTAQYPQSHFPVDISSRTTFRLAAYQGSGSTMSVTGRMYATRIK